MKYFKIILFHCVVIISMALSCEKEQDDDCNEPGDGTEAETKGFFDINTPYAWIQNVNENETTVNFVIQNQQDYEKYVGIRTDTIRPEIDFNKYLLLAGRIIHPSCGFIENQNVKQKCNTYYYTVNIANGVCGAVVKVHYFVIVSNNTISEVEFNISL